MTLVDVVARWSAEYAEPGAIQRLAPELGRALGERDYDAMAGLATRLARAALTDPERVLVECGAAFTSVHEIVSALRMPEARADVSDDALLALLDIANFYTCIGSPLPASVEKIAGSWLDDLSRRARGPEVIKIGLAGLALSDMIVAHRAAGIPEGATAPFDAKATFRRDPMGVLRHLVGAVRTGCDSRKVLPAMRRMVEEYGETDVDEPALLWLMRVVFVEVVKKPVKDVAAIAHERIWDIASDLAYYHSPARVAYDARRAALDSSVGLTFADGRYTIRELLQGEGTQRLCLGTRDDGAEVLVALDYHFSRNTFEAVLAKVAYHSPGLFELEGLYDIDVPADPERANYQHGRWGLVERVAGTWVPKLVREIDRDAAVPTAAMLGCSAGRIVATAAKAGLALAPLRPELMWARRVGDHVEVTGLTTRPHALFEMSRADAVTYPVFATSYAAPEGEASPVYSLAVMVAEWATGHPYARALYVDYGPRPRDWSLAMDIPHELEALLRRAIDPERRPALDSFIAELERFT